MKRSLKTIAAAASIGLSAMTAAAQDSTHQRFLFLADDAHDSAAANPAQAAVLARKVVAHAVQYGFNYGDTIQLATVPGGSPLWDQEIDILRSQGNHPNQLEGFLTRSLVELGQGPLRNRSQIVWAMQALNLTCDGPEPTFVYVFTNGVSAVDIQGDDVFGEGTAPGALQGCPIQFVGLGLNGTADLSMTAKMRLDHLFGQIAEGAGGSHDIIR